MVLFRNLSRNFMPYDNSIWNWRTRGLKWLEFLSDWLLFLLNICLYKRNYRSNHKACLECQNLEPNSGNWFPCAISWSICTLLLSGRHSINNNSFYIHRTTSFNAYFLCLPNFMYLRNV